MTTDALLERHRARPFQPFSIGIGDGQALRVDHPEMLAYAPKGRTAVVYKPDGSFQIIDLLLVTGLQVDAPRPGRRRRRLSH